MLLRPVQLRWREGAGIQALVDIAIEGQHGLLGVVGGEPGRPGFVARHIQARELVRQRHQLGDLLRRLFTQHLDELARLRQKRR